MKTNVNPPPLWIMALVVGLFSMLGALSIDIYFPSFGAMEIAFGASPASIQQTLTAYMIPYAVASLFYGPLSDALGRRTLLLSSLVMFGVASLACALSDSLEAVLAWRAIQGISAGAPKVLGRAIVRDLYSPDQTQRTMAWVGVLFGIAPACAPVLGGWLQVTVGWQGAFVFVAVFTVAVAALTWWKVPETHPREKRLPLEVGGLLRQCGLLLRNRRFVQISILLGLGFAPAFLCIASAPRIVMGHWGLSETGFGYLAFPMTAGMMLGGVVAARLAGRVGRNQAIASGLLLTLFFAVGTLFAATSGAGHLVAVIPMALMAASSSLIFPALTVEALESAQQARGTASSLSSAISLAVIAVVGGSSPLVAQSSVMLATAAVGLSLLAVLTWVGIVLPGRVECGQAEAGEHP